MQTRLVSAPAFLGMMAASGAFSFALLWAWVVLAPLAFLDPEYPAWVAKRSLLAHCDLGEVVVVGDSRAAADVLPALLPLRATNLAVGGGESVEAYTAIARALSCPEPPRRVIVSLGAGHFMTPDLFWERSVKFGFIGPADVALLRHESERLDDWSVYAEQHGDRLRGRVRAALYAIRFPSLYFANVAKGGVLLRLWENRRALAAVLAARGQYYFGTADGSTDVAAEGHLGVFRPLPILDAYFDSMLSLLAAHGVAVDLVPMPVNHATWQATNPRLRQGFASYLQAYARRYPNVRVGEPMPDWPDRFFGDEFAHLNRTGAMLLSARLGACLAAGNSPCPLGWHDNPKAASSHDQRARPERTASAL